MTKKVPSSNSSGPKPGRKQSNLLKATSKASRAAEKAEAEYSTSSSCHGGDKKRVKIDSVQTYVGSPEQSVHSSYLPEISFGGDQYFKFEEQTCKSQASD